MKPDILRAALAAVLVMLFAAPAWSQDDEAERKVGDAGMPTDPDNGGPWVMWKGTPYAHVMVPVPGHDGASGHATAPVPGPETDSGHD